MKRYNESAKVEVDILSDIMEKGGAMFGVVHLKEYFIHADKDGEHMCLVFETLGKSLYEKHPLIDTNVLCPVEI